MDQIDYSKKITVKYEVDVCVVGAGPSGVAAALSAARGGKKVIVFDACAMAGGMGTAGKLPVFMPFTNGVDFLAGGVGREVHDRGVKMGAIGYDHGVSINAEALTRMYDQMLLESGVIISYQTSLVDAVMSGPSIKAAVFSAKSGMFAVSASVYIDCSGDGDLAFMTGASYEIGDENGRMMPTTLCSTWAGVDWKINRAGGIFSHNDENMLSLLRKANEAGELTDDDYHHTGLALCSKHTVGGNIGHCFGVDSTDEISLTRGMIEGRELLADYEKFYRKYIPGFNDAELIGAGSLLGVREGRRIVGGYVLCADDYKQRASFDDEIGRYCFGIDLHPSVPGEAALIEHKKHFQGERYAKGESYGIPYRILCPDKVDNLLTAGRCVSTDRYVMASLRVMPGSFITGMASGIAASIAISSGKSPRDIDVRTLQGQLAEKGAFLPNFK